SLCLRDFGGLRLCGGGWWRRPRARGGRCGGYESGESGGRRWALLGGSSSPDVRVGAGVVEDLRNAMDKDNVDEIKSKIGAANKALSKIGRHMAGRRFERRFFIIWWFTGR
ncbi:hypothetical protein Dimus_035189, partial [Dionaea muscipula]